ncbi:imidazolonepropionase-like amidohydrolase [Chitinophaga skermanii]|uniref:Imidazolonepropionase-like amidohydrolase n=1 Tax=Chitinophaga skermanii TaxID=331697 RepID=A0A327R456_9BACT|nr:amidohydrolase family protein [Chitinophaga skermanii]RAJ10995.1 imidazolonepropionase-like amidohydrolase [Chitinophaga skermanii]
MTAGFSFPGKSRQLPLRKRKGLPGISFYKHKTLYGVVGLLMAAMGAKAQATFPVNGVNAPREACYAFTHATIVKDGVSKLNDATLLIRDGKIVAAGNGVAIPKDAVVVDCNGKYIYPSFIDAYSDYGTTAASRQRNFNAAPQFISNAKGPYGWNQAIKSEFNVVQSFVVDDAKAKSYRDAGFGVVLTHQADGIARGTGAIVTLASDRENKVILKEKASAHYSFEKGSSTQDYPSSLMGSIALLRQSFLDAQWYKSNPAKEGVNLSLQAWNDNQPLLQIFEANDKWNALRADKIGDEFGVQYVIKAGGNEYQRIADMQATKATFILPVNYPAVMDVEDPNDARFVAVSELKHWELAPTEAGAFEKANIPFVLTAADLKDTKSFIANVRKAIQYGLSEQRAIDALTKAPATLLKVYDKVGSLDAGKLANFFIASGPVFNDGTVIYQNWVQGNKYVVNDDAWKDIRGTYTLQANNASYTVELKGSAASPSLTVIKGDTLTGKLDVSGQLVKLNVPLTKDNKQQLRLSGVMGDAGWAGNGVDENGKPVLWTLAFNKAFTPKADADKKKDTPVLGKLYFPFSGYGAETAPKQEDILIRNATVWTSEKDGKLENTDVLIKGGKIAQVGKNLAASSARVIDGTGKHLTAGIIDEHSHIAISRGVNEGTQSVTSEVRIADVLNPDDINIYRQLSGGVTTSHLLHGSANVIGGQTQLIKLRWGVNAEQLKFANWDPFIKFALGENVKQSNWGDRQTVRFPQTRMGVEQLLVDAFTRARDYEKQGANKRRDLELDALVEILNKKRFITCHSYVQSEINMLMKVADRFNFTVNTFTHILEGYKVADKMKTHGAGASTFADWWAYKMEVTDAIPQNASIMQRVGLTVAINSDDAEMARRLNQEAAKSVKYGSMNELDALNMVTINPAKLLHIADRTGSIKVGKDADVVLWSDHPLSIYAKAEKTIVDGTVYFDREQDLKLRDRIAKEKAALIQKALNEKKRGGPTQRAVPTIDVLWHCEDEERGHQKQLFDEHDVMETTASQSSH